MGWAQNYLTTRTFYSSNLNTNTHCLICQLQGKEDKEESPQCGTIAGVGFYGSTASHDAASFGWQAWRTTRPPHHLMDWEPREGLRVQEME